jgi:hypothetical protein
MVRSKRPSLAQPKQTRHLCVVADLWVSVQRQVHCVETTLALNERLHPPKVRPDQSLWLAPEQPMMDDEKLHPLRDSLFERSQTGIYSERHSLHLDRAFNLQAILRFILNLSDVEIVIEVINQFVASHSKILVPDIEDR